MPKLSVADHVAPLALSRPPVDALSEEWGEALQLELTSLESRDDWTLLHLGSTQKVLAAGADLAQIHTWLTERTPGARVAAFSGWRSCHA